MTVEVGSMEVNATMATDLTIGYATDEDGNQAIGMIFDTVMGQAIFIVAPDEADKLSEGLAIMANELRRSFGKTQ